MFRLEDIRVDGILEIDHLTFPQSTVSCIVGPSGAGKSTLLELLNNLLSVDQGRVLYQGSNLEEIDPISLRREVIMLPQKPVVFSGTVSDNLTIGFRLREENPPAKVDLHNILDVVALDKGLDYKATKLSSGEQQRLVLARALLLEPEVFLLDEPSSALDTATEEIVIEQVVDYVTSKQKTLIMVTHSEEIAATYGDRVVTIEQGQVVGEEEL